LFHVQRGLTVALRRALKGCKKSAGGIPKPAK
jgi:hypothetical protein